MNRQELNLLETPLRGTNLIEANAGTGKTYNITGLFTRMLVELGFSVESILVVTFTNAAVSDLKSKIYTRLSSVYAAMDAALNGKEYINDDPFPAKYADARRDTLAKDIKTIRDALRDFDQCAVFTIHSFCQRMLKESAFSGRIAYDVELTGDGRELIKGPVYDFWRKTVYKAPPTVIPYLLTFSPDDLIDFYLQVQGNPSIEFVPPEREISTEQLAAEAEKLQTAFSKAADNWRIHKDEIIKLLDPAQKDYPLSGRVYRADWLAGTYRTLETYIAEGICTLPANDKSLVRLTQSKINDSVKKGTAPGHEFFRLFEGWYIAAEDFRDTVRQFTGSVRHSLCMYMDKVLEKHKTKNDLQSYDDLIARMRSAVLENEGHGDMTRSLGRKFKAALIDEFQDTDPYQYDIFHTAFAKQSKPFFMIGDPKQAIYSFRGADVFAYLKAAGEKSSQYTLTDNYRSDPELVSRLNSFFDKDNPFLLEQIDYKPSNGALPPCPLVISDKPQPPVTLWVTDRVNQETVAKSTARHIAELLNMSGAGQASINGEKIRPSDIAVLCRSKSQLMKVKSALAQCRVPAVVSGSESVFATEEAAEMADILSAVLHPYSPRRIKTALAMAVFGYTADMLYGIEETDEWDDITAEFTRLNDLINMRGFAPMFFLLADSHGMYSRLAGMPGGERKLTNMVHLAELAQRYEADRKAAPQDILKWMKERIAAGDVRDDEAELKMDSDENAVTIVTVHKSKGLEYKIVYTPFLMYKTSDRTAADKRIYKYHEDEKYLLDTSPEASGKAALEEMAEDLRIAYVALTRGKTACFTAWGSVDGHDGSAMSYIINGAHSKFNPDTLKDFTARSGIIQKPLPADDIMLFTGSAERPKSKNKEFRGNIPAIWRINSFSGLVHSTSSGAKDTDQFTAQAAKEESRVFDIFTFPKGAKAGTCLHECMEETPFESCTRDSILTTVTEKLENYSFDPVFAPAVTDCITSVTEKDMGGFTLKDLGAEDYAHEMEFQIASGAFDSDKLADIFNAHGEEDFAKAAASLSFDAVQGYINGFADLIFTVKDRYYIIDWKSNHLGDSKEAYGIDAMHGEMLGSHYYLQLYIYTLALHLHLKKQLPGYSYDKHFGGGLYIFMRGVNAVGAEGVYTHRPKREIIEDMEKLVGRYERA